jgi:hypothetical protein
VIGTGNPRVIQDLPRPVPVPLKRGTGFRRVGVRVPAGLCNIPAGSVYIELNIYNTNLILYKIYNKHPSKFIRGLGKIRERNHTNKSVVSCMVYVVGQRKDAEHETTPTRGVVLCSACGEA